MAKTSVTIPDDLFEEAKAFSGNFSAFVTEALREYLRREKIKKAAKSFGKWGERDQASIDMVNDMRSDKRGYADRSH